MQFHPKADAGQQRDRQDRHGREGEGPHRRAGIPLPETGEQQGEKGRREGGAGARSRLLRFVHRG